MLPLRLLSVRSWLLHKWWWLGGIQFERSKTKKDKYSRHSWSALDAYGDCGLLLARESDQSAAA